MVWQGWKSQDGVYAQHSPAEPVVGMRGWTHHPVALVVQFWDSAQILSWGASSEDEFLPHYEPNEIYIHLSL